MTDRMSANKGEAEDDKSSGGEDDQESHAECPMEQALELLQAGSPDVG